MEQKKQQNEFGRRIKFFGALLFLGLSSVAFYPQFVYTVSDRAVTNAWTISLAAPIEGTLEGLQVTKGQQVKSGEILGSITNNTLDRSRQFEVETEWGKNRAQLAAYEKQKEMLTQRVSQLEQDHKTWLDAHRQYLISQLQQAEAEAVRDRGNLIFMQTEHKRMRQLLAEGVVSQSKFDEIDKDRLKAEKAVTIDASEIDKTKTSLKAIEQGFSIATTYDRSNTRQQIDELKNELAQLDAKILYNRNLDSVLELEKTRQKDMVAERSRAVIKTPVDGKVWRLFDYATREVRNGQPVMQIVKSDQMFISAIFKQKYMDKIKTGSPAIINLETGEKVTGRVSRIAGFDRSEVAVPSAAAVTLEFKDEEQFEVTVELDNPLSNTEAGTYARVFINS